MSTELGRELTIISPVNKLLPEEDGRNLASTAETGKSRWNYQEILAKGVALLVTVGIATFTFIGIPDSKANSNPNQSTSITKSECINIQGTWVQLIHADTPNYSGTHQELCPTPIAVSLEPGAPGYDIFTKIALGQASNEEIKTFNDTAREEMTVKTIPEIPGLTAMQYVIDDNGERRLVNGYVNNQGKLIKYFGADGSLIQFTP